MGWAVGTWGLVQCHTGGDVPDRVERREGRGERRESRQVDGYVDSQAGG